MMLLGRVRLMDPSSVSLLSARDFFVRMPFCVTEESYGKIWADRHECVSQLSNRYALEKEHCFGKCNDFLRCIQCPRAEEILDF